MGKSGYKRFKKQEKVKVKLKGNKALLPKGQNVTDTTFRVKKIIIKEQLKEHGEQEILTKKHLNVKDLISRINHHNVTMRQEAVNGLRELINAHGRNIVLTNLSTLLQASTSLTIDKETSIRSDTLKLLSSVFEKVTEEELSPIFSVVVCHLTCGMTHIDPGVRADSLRLLDIMLARLPTLTAAHTATLLPHFLDLISQKPGEQGERTLSLHLDGQVTSEKWRCRVIGRLNRLFSVIWNHINRGQTQTQRSVRWLPSQQTYLSVFSPLTSMSKKEDNINNLPMKEYADMLLPLLLDTFIEAVPKQSKTKPESGCGIEGDTAALLQNIVEVLLHIWNMLDRLSQTENLISWFKQTWGRQVIGRLVEDRFPYSVSSGNSRKRQRHHEKMLAVLQMTSIPSCSLLNLQLCLLTFLLAVPGPIWTHCVQYIKRTLRNKGVLKVDEIGVLCQCLEAASSHSLDGCSSLLSILAKSNILNNVDKPINRRAFNFLSSVALKPSHHLHQDKHFTTWLDSLPALLSKPSIPLSVLQKIASIASHNLPAFSNSLDGWIEAILDNLPSLKVSKDVREEGPRLALGLLYWVTDWDKSLAESVVQLVQHGSLGAKLTAHLVDVLRLKMDSFENKEIKSIFEQILPL